MGGGWDYKQTDKKGKGSYIMKHYVTSKNCVIKLSYNDKGKRR